MRDALELHLRHEPTKVSRSRIKRLRGLEHPQYRLRIDEFRAFYDVIEQCVVVVAIILKSRAEEWLGQHGVLDDLGESDEEVSDD